MQYYYNNRKYNELSYYHKQYFTIPIEIKYTKLSEHYISFKFGWKIFNNVNSLFYTSDDTRKRKIKITPEITLSNSSRGLRRVL